MPNAFTPTCQRPRLGRRAKINASDRRRRANAKQRTLPFTADALALAAAFGKSVSFPDLDYALFYRTAAEEALRREEHDPTETVSLAMRHFLASLLRLDREPPRSAEWCAKCARNAVREVILARVRVARWRREVARSILIGRIRHGDAEDDAGDDLCPAVATPGTDQVMMDWDALRTLPPIDRRLLIAYLRHVTALTPGRVRDVAGKGLDHNARESLSSFAQDFLGLKKAQAWIHAKRVIEAIRDGLYLADWRLPS